MKQIYLLTAAMLLCNLIFCQPALQEPQSTYVPSETVVDTLDDDYLLDDGTHSLNQIVVSANRFEQQRKDIPQQTEIITSSSMAFDNQQTSGDVIQNTGNILVQKSQLGGGSPVIRGFETNKVLLVVDGVRMNNAIYRAGHLQNIISLDNATMDRIEILYGPGSVMYGSDALGGVMHFMTKNPTFSTDGTTAIHGSAFARYSTADAEKTGHVDLSIGGSKFGSLTSFTYSDFDDLIQGSQRSDDYPDFGKRTFYVERQGNTDVAIANDDVDKQIGSGYSQYDILQKFVYRASDAVSHTLNFQYSASSDVPRYDRLTQGSLQSPTYAEWYYGPQKRLMASYRMGMNKGTGLLGTGGVTVAYQSIEESRHDRRFNNVNLNHRIEKLNILTLNADFTHQTGASTWSYGLEGTYNKVNSTAHRDKIDTGAEVPLDTRYPNGGSTVSSAALYLNDSYAVSDHFRLQAGVRGAYHTLNSKFDDKTFFPFPFDEVSQSSVVATGSVGFVWNSDGGSRLNFIASSGFRAPSVDDMSKVFESVAGRVIVPNPELGPEHTYNVDLGISQNINDRLEIGVEGFYTWYRNAITTAPGTFNGADSVEYNGSLSAVVTNVNAKKAFVYGGNAYASLDITNSLSLYSTINYTYGRIERENDEVPLDHVAPLFGKTSLRWNKDKIRAEAYAMYNGAKKLEDYNPDGEDNLPYATVDGMPAWMTLNVKGSYQFTKNFTLQLGVENILDENYRIFSSNISAPGRNIVVTVRGSW
ncbi:MAG TPA: TonB-dependent receptor [Saprospiraceae bacterium]|nr:TonB-dependent receptor [Saprospiraceae bacterium]